MELGYTSGEVEITLASDALGSEGILALLLLGRGGAMEWSHVLTMRDTSTRLSARQRL